MIRDKFILWSCLSKVSFHQVGEVLNLFAFTELAGFSQGRSVWRLPPGSRSRKPGQVVLNET